MTHSIQPKNLLAGLGLALLMLSSPIAVYVWQLMGFAPQADLAHPLLLITITNGFSILLLIGIYYRFWVRLSQLEQGEGNSQFLSPESRDTSWRTRYRDRQQAELQEQNFVSVILDTANALIIVLDQQGRIIRFNHTCERLTGYSFEEVKGKYIWDLFLIPEDIESVKTIIRELQACHFPNEHENYWLARDGTRRLISWYNTVLLDDNGAVKYLIGIGIDITERQQAEQMRRQLERQQELSQLQLRFFSLVSHEFRTPLSTILASVQLLQLCPNKFSPDKKLRNLQRIESAAQRLRQMLDNILIINRAETGQLDSQPTPINPEQFCQGLLAEIPHNSDKHYALNFVQQTDCKNAYLDDKLLRSILSNLLTNAIKYSLSGGTIDLQLTCTPTEVIFQVRDQGIGIPAADIPHIFEPFHRGKNIDSIPGSGLGLTVAKTCVNLHGGNISVTSELGVGTTFTVTIPG
ncbi:MAG: PAS domain-containing sensor histidine kinase [Coleofasciculus sp. C1-SOL-03]|uniref:PAS domain-containing sensor histidine kinase n=1 Tax=Coleofasciculus sp. C1-SOL-03 TaxID=3069522 RepID=UPI0032FF2E18